MLIRNVTVIDVVSGRAIPGQDLAVSGRRIEARERHTPSSSDEGLDGSGLYLCPGLIDCHVHLFLSAGDDPLSDYLKSNNHQKLETAAANALLALQAGITTVRDCGGPADLVFAFKRSVERGAVPGPRIVAAGAPLTRPLGHCHFFGLEVTTVHGVQRAIEAQVARGAEFVKLIASGGGLTPGTSAAEADLPLELMKAAVATAKANRLPVAVHCHATESIVRALDAGANIIEHASFVANDGTPHFDAEIAARIRKEGAIVSPTAISGMRIADAIRRNGHGAASIPRLEARRNHLSRFFESGARIVAGSDCGVANTRFDSLIDELIEYNKAGMTCGEALRCATSDSASYLNQSSLGQLGRGFFADMLLLKENPLVSLEALRQPLIVIRNGEIVCDRRLSLVTAH